MNILIISIILFIGGILLYVFFPKYYSYYLKKRENKLKREITQNISHELKTPLAGILGYIESIIDNEDLPPEKVQYFLEKTHLQAKRLQSLLNDISVLNKLDEKKQVYEFEQVNILSVVNEVLEDVDDTMKEKSTHAIINIPHNTQIVGNRSLIYSTFRNLIDNSIAYAGENITIQIKVEKEDKRYYYFEFSDNGIGIEKQHRSRIFERFYRVEKGRSRKSGGTGLGLAIVKNAIQLHHGDIHLECPQEGGTKFHFSIRKT